MAQTAQPTRENLLQAKATLARWYASTDPGKNAAFTQLVQDAWTRNGIVHQGKQEPVDAMKIVAAVAGQTTDDEWVSFLNSGELPAIKLAPAQMEAVRGGGIVAALALLGAETTVAVFAATAVGVYVYESTGMSWW